MAMGRRHRSILLIAGMHRSGTSALTGALVELGAGGPVDPMPATPDNPKGYGESQRLCRLHDRILTAANSAWDDIRPIEPAWFESAAAASLGAELSETLAESYPPAPLIAVKDPRLCRVLPLWLRQLDADGIDVRIASPLRSPLEVARSLAARDGMTKRFALLLWLRNVLDAEAASRGRTRYFMSYDRLLRNWRGAIDEMLAGLGLEGASTTRGDGEAFVDPNLRRWSVPPGEIDTTPEAAHWVREAAMALWTLSSAPTEDRAAAAQSQLDATADAFNAAAAVFGPLLEEGRRGAAAAETALAAERDRRHQAEHERDLALTEASDLFDADWYYAHYPDVREAKLRPAEHFLRHGVVDGRSPGPAFDASWYLAVHPDVASTGLNPLIHYLRYGRVEGRTTRPTPHGAGDPAR